MNCSQGWMPGHASWSLREVKSAELIEQQGWGW